MLNVGFSELLLIVVAAILFIGPKDYPAVIRFVAKTIREFRAFIHGMKSQMDGVMRDAGIDEFKAQTRTIIDLDGKPQIAYDVSDLTPPTKEEPKP